MKSNNVQIGELAHGDKGAFKIGPFGSSLKKSELVESGIPVAGIENVLPNAFTKGFRRFITPQKFSELSDYEIRPDDVLVTTMGTIGRAAVAPPELGRAIIDSHLFRMRVDTKRVSPQYLCYALNSDLVVAQLSRNSRGAIMDGLNTSILRECVIPLPGLSEQRRIAGELERADGLRRTRRYALELADTFLPAAFLQLFGDPRTNPKDFPLVELGELVSTKPQIGTATPCTPDGEYRCVRVGEVGDGEIDLASCEFVSLSAKEFERYQVLPGDILLARAIGSEDHLGKLSVSKKIHTPLVYDSHLMRVRLKAEMLMPCFVAAFLQSPSGRAIFMRQARRTAVQFNINSEQISALRLPVPPLPLQTRFAELVERHERLRSVQCESLRQAEHLFQTLLNKSFATK